MTIPPIQSIASGSVNPLTPTGPTAPASKTGNSQGGAGFIELFSKLAENSNQQQLAANQAIDQLVNHESGDLQSVVMSMAKADLSLKFIVEIRNKLMDAYQEIMRMQV